LESSYEFVGQINSKGFQGVFSIFFYTKKMLAKFTNIKKYRAKILHPTRWGVLPVLLLCFLSFLYFRFTLKNNLVILK
ncbi:hypothetical protein ACWODU_14055, partial [Enterococcus durans]